MRRMLRKRAAWAILCLFLLSYLLPVRGQSASDFAGAVSETAVQAGVTAEQTAGAVAQASETTASGQMAADGPVRFTDRVTDWYRDHLSLGTVALLMALESSFIPFPSEVVVPPAAYWACQAGSDLYLTASPWLNVLAVVAAGSLGALLGALFNYLLALWVGRPVVYGFAESRAGRFLLLSGAKVEKAEQYFLHYGKVSTLIGRLVPVVRQLISLPAGLARMRMTVLLLYTFIGATFWNLVLALFGYLAHGQQALIARYSHEISIAICGLAVIFVIYLLYKGLKK